MAPPKGFRHTPEALAKIAAASRARTFSAETVEKRAAKWRGRKLTPDQVARLSAAKKGKPQSSTQIAGIRRWLDTPRFKALNVGRKLTVVDVFVPSRNLVIECDGTYWHRNRGEQDSKRDAHMTSLGLRVLRLPEPDIRSGAYAHAVKRILGMAM